MSQQAVSSPVGSDAPGLELLTLLRPSTIRAAVAVADWEQAADVAGQLLVDANLTAPGYVTAMKRVLREMGPYAVIAPGIVLLHARPEDGVLQPCLALVTLSTPVEFGHSENDPVDVVLALGATDKQTHISALQQLAELLGDESAMTAIRSATDTSTLIATLHSLSTTNPTQGALD